MAGIRGLTSVFLVVVVSCGCTRAVSLSEDSATNPHRIIEAANHDTPIIGAPGSQRSDEIRPVAKANSAHYVPDSHRSFRFCLVGTDDCLALTDGDWEVCFLSFNRCPAEARAERAFAAVREPTDR